MKQFLMIFTALILLPLFSINAEVRKDLKDTTKAATAKAKVTADAKTDTTKAATAKADTTKEEPKIITTESGLRYIDLEVGTGEVSKKGMKVEMHYTVWISKNDKKAKRLQSSLDTNKPLAFTIGQSNLIAGWNEGAVGMKVGGTRKLFVPSKLGWGARGYGADIPPNADVIFELIFVKVVK